MKIILKAFLTLIVLLNLFSCSNPVHIPENQQLYFDAEKYFLGEAEMLNKKHSGITKTILKEYTSETINVKNADWKKELKPFFQIELNKPAQVNSFTIDSILHGTNLTVIYSAKEKSEELRKLYIYSTNNYPDSIMAIMQASNIYYKSADTISYLGNGNYRIRTRNKPRIGKEISFVLEGKATL